MSRLVSAAALAVALTAMPALAADKAGPAPVQPSVADIVPSMTPSCYAAALAGASVDSVRVKEEGFLPETVSAQSFTIAGRLGCDIRISRVVVGALAQIEVPVDSADLIKAEKAWMAAGRLGYLVTPNFMVYGIAGYAQNEWKIDVDSFDRNGMVLGGGVEFGISKHVSFTAEYLQTGLGRLSDGVTTLEPANHTARVGILYRFNSLMGD